MSTKGYDVFYMEPDTIAEMFCLICGTRCQVERSVYGATGFAESLARKGHWHDSFRCPHADLLWHEQALELVMLIEETPSKRLAAILKLDLEDILRENGIMQS